MKRKIIKQGIGAYTLTLPIDWIREYNLTQGSEVELSEVEEGLLITSDLIKREKQIKIEFNESYSRRMIYILICQAYRLGYDKIQINNLNNSQLNMIKDVLNSLIGFEIINKTNLSCILENIAEPDPAKFDVMLRKMFLQILELSEFTFDNLSRGIYDEKKCDEFKILIERLTNYTRRTIIRTRQGGEKSSLLYSICSKISLINHAYCYLYKYAEEHRFKTTPELTALFSSVNQLLRKFYESFYSRNQFELYDIGEKKIELFWKFDEFLETNKGPENVVIAYLREITRLIQMSSAFTAGYVL